MHCRQDHCTHARRAPPRAGEANSLVVLAEPVCDLAANARCRGLPGSSIDALERGRGARGTRRTIAPVRVNTGSTDQPDHRFDIV
jgi:hypothetical protein